MKLSAQRENSIRFGALTTSLFAAKQILLCALFNHRLGDTLPPGQFSGRVVSWVAPDSPVLARLKLTPSLN